MKQKEDAFGRIPFGEMRAEHLMKKDIPYYRSDTRGLTLATAMIDGGCGAIPIVDDQKQLIGVVTEFDLLNAILQGKDLRSVKGLEVMAREPKFVKQETLVGEIIRIMDSLHLIHTPVVDQQGRLVGLIERRNILSSYTQSRSAP
jgi:CBS domain-containing protein